ncbi:MAG TPA: GGDEF domain-containing protein [Candidatus Dormibacteraeota bacterium]
MNNPLRRQDTAGSPPAVALGLTLAERMPSFLAQMEARIQEMDERNPVLPEEFRLRERLTRQYATLLIGRWLVSGASASEEEAGWISEQGRVAAGAGLPIAAVAKHYFMWRDNTNAFLQELATELETPEPVIEAALQGVRSSADASILRLVRDYDHEMHRLRELLHAEQSSLRHQALHDALTGLPNRSLFYDRLDQALAGYRREQVGFSVMLLDLNRFKEINDTLGHQTGDLVLRHLSSQLRPLLREVDTLARWGGDEFGIILPTADLRQALRVAARLQQALATPLIAQGFRLRPESSIGIATCPEHGIEGEALLQHADVALYIAKRAHGGIATYDAGGINEATAQA